MSNVKRLRKRAIGKFLISIVLPSMLLIFAAKLFMTDLPEGDREGHLEAALATGLHAKARDIVAEYLKIDPTNPDHHYNFIQYHFMLPKGGRNDDNLVLQYEAYAESPDPGFQDAGHYSLGLIYSKQKKYKKALREFAQVQNRQLKYLNNSSGFALMNLKRADEAEHAFLQAIQYNGNKKGAVANYSKLLRSQRRFDEFDEMTRNPELEPYIPASVKAGVYIHSFHVFHATAAMFEQSFEGADLTSMLGATIVMLIWFLFLKKLDIFEPEKNRYLILTLFLGAFFSLLAVFLYDIFKYDLGIRLTGNWLGDLLFCIFGIGMIEEALKIIPLLIMMKFTNEVDESVDIILYASVSALGFAFMENILYFSGYGLHLIHTRALSSVVIHMFCSGVVAYGLVCAKYREGGHDKTLFFLLAFGFACLIHGLFDYWLVSDWMPPEARLLSLAIHVYCVIGFNRIVNNALNHSEFFNAESLSKINYTREWLGWSLAALVVFEYYLIAIRFGPAVAMESLGPTLVFSWIIIYFLSFTLGNYNLTAKGWVPLLWKFNSKESKIKKEIA